MFNHARRWGLVDDNPFAGQPMPKSQSRPKRIFNPEEIKAMIAVAPSLWWKAFIQLAYTSGLRRNELLHLQWRDVDFDNAVIQVTAKNRTRFAVGQAEYWTLEWSPKSHHVRAIPLPHETLAILKQLKAASDSSLYCFISLERLATMERKRAAGTLRARYEAVNNVLRDFKVIQQHAAKSSGSKDWIVGTIHDLRRTYGTRLADIVPMHVLQRWMGHSDIAVTSSYYLDVSSHHGEQARRAFEAHRYSSLRLVS
jgi:integrase